jgi:hypothetical protein
MLMQCTHHTSLLSLLDQLEAEHLILTAELRNALQSPRRSPKQSGVRRRWPLKLCEEDYRTWQ